MVLALTPDEVASGIEVRNEMPRNFIEQQIVRFSTPEKRELQQIVFPDDESAKTALEKIRGGAWFENVATERGLSPTDINLGTVAKSAIVDPAIAEAAFRLEPGIVSEPVYSGRFGKVLVRVNRVNRPRPRRSPIRRRYQEVIAGTTPEPNSPSAATRSRTSSLAGPSSTKPLRRPARRYASSTLSTAPAAGRMAIRSLLSPAALTCFLTPFSTDVGVESDPVQANGGFVWFEVGGISPAHERALDEVKDRVEVRCRREDQLGTRLKAKADEIVEKIKGGKSFEEAIAGDEPHDRFRKECEARRRRQPASARRCGGVPHR